jgi:integrase
MNKKKRATDKTLLEAIDDYVESKSNVLSPSSLMGYAIMKRNSFHSIENVKICNLTEIHIQKWANENAKHYSAKSIRNQVGLLSAVLKQNKVHIDFSDISLKPMQKTDYIVPDVEQCAKIIDIVRGTEIEIQVLLALMLGLRQSEIAGLKWTNYNGKTLLVKGAIVPNAEHKWVEKPTNKSYSSTRELDVPTYLKEILDKAKETSNGEYISKFKPPAVLKRFKRLCRVNGLPEFKMHSLRHANASMMLLQGVSDKYAMERLGQSTPNMIKNVYQHTFKSEQSKVSEKMDDFFTDIIQHKIQHN